MATGPEDDQGDLALTKYRTGEVDAYVRIANYRYTKRAVELLSPVIRPSSMRTDKYYFIIPDRQHAWTNFCI